MQLLLRLRQAWTRCVVPALVSSAAKRGLLSALAFAASAPIVHARNGGRDEREENVEK